MSKENKLTIEDAMKYPNAEYSINDWKGKIIEINIPKNSLRLESETGTSFGVSVSDCKLILRSIEKLTNEEKKEIQETYFYFAYENSDVDWLDFQDISTNIKHPIEFIDYLRSISVDIDGFEKQGVAVYESEGKP